MTVEFRRLLGDQRSRTRKGESRGHLGFVPILDVNSDRLAGNALLAQQDGIGRLARQIDALPALEDAFHLQFRNQALDGIDAVVTETVALLRVPPANPLR